MSRPSSTSQRPLTLTEELEKLEQSITLTLQEIDHNFSQAHRIVTTSILPIVEQYAENSRDVWEGAKFWKQFFEASANVSLSGYEERPDEDTMQEQPVTEDDSTVDVTHSNLTETATYETPSSERLEINHRPDDMELTSLSLSSHSTPRPPVFDRPDDINTTVTSSIARPSPYAEMKREVDESDAPFDDDDDGLPTTAGRLFHPQGYSYNQHDDLMSSSPFVPPVSHENLSTTGKSPADPVLHRLHDKTYRVQATPLGKGYGTGRSKFAITPKPSTSKYGGYDDSPISSPEPEAPQLHAEIFSSPLKTPRTNRKRRASSNLRVTPKPGTSVLTPAKSGTRNRPVWDSDDDFDMDEDEDLDPSPPKTMQFHIPQSRLMKTPAKEASRRIVEDLLFTAGANDTMDDVPDEQSPSIIQRVQRIEDETF
ncbi:DASH complex subunit Ask1-domain-containing protein [Aspergillus coremiiformis]|uniref:DASH complex subunit ASK1 n=1 Tax=Aspergillus coremiiformis TaxID=138285 RepID=A0A5N6YW16_9EURO|nr:DASH complex subunit Ask1-domain-containing protein [Aspergillus coremiiformis]